MDHDRVGPDYRAYLLRCRRSRSTRASGTWRCSLEDPHTGQRRMFATLDELLDALRRELQDDTPTDDVPPGAPTT